MRRSGTVLMDDKGAEIARLGAEPGDVKLPNGDVVCGLKPGQAAGKFRLVERFEDDASPPALSKRTGQTEAFDGTKIVVTPTWVKLTREELRGLVDDRMDRLFRRAEREKNETQGALFRDQVRTHATLMRDAYRDGKPIDIETGAIDGTGGWPS